jgi:hypothetical protein
MATHLIHRINLTVEVPDERMAGPIQQNAVELLYHNILPRLEKVLDELSFSADRVSIDEVNLDAGRLNSNEFDALFPLSVEKSLRAELSLAGRPETKMPGSGPAAEKGAEAAGPDEEAISVETRAMRENAVAANSGTGTVRPPGQATTGKEVRSVSFPGQAAPEGGTGFFRAPEKTVKEGRGRIVRSAGQAAAESFLYFLETGSLPWWCKTGEAPDESQLTVLLTSSEKLFLSNGEEFCNALLQLLMTSPVAARRLILQFPATFVRELFSALMNPLSCLSSAQTEEAPAQTKEGTVSDEDTAVSNSLPDFGGFTSRLLRQMETGSDGPDHFAAAQWQEGVSPASKNLPHMPLKPAVPEQIVDHAGLILLHPFLESLFSEFGLLEEGKLKNQAYQARAVHLLAYLATGQENLPEFALQFEKYLCGMKPDEALPRFVQLPLEMKEEAETLLKAAIRHWKTLKSTSPEGLREGFLERKGKLITAGLQHRLIVEQRPHDLLLAYLPWGISMVRLRWLDQVLTVDWNP